MLLKITKKITELIILNVEGTTQEKAEQINYGLYVFISDTLKLLAVLLTAMILGQFKYAAVACAVFAVTKSYWGGIHAKTQVGCIIMHFTFIFGTVYLAQIIKLPYLNIVLFVVIGILIFLYAPADLPSKPIISLKRKKELQIKSAVVWIIFFAITFLVPGSYSNAISIIALLAAINTTPVAYMVTGNRRGGVIN
jgi:accessory gene regulator B